MDGMTEASDLPAHDVRDNPAGRRYELFVGDQLIGFADYFRQGDLVVLPHTVIEPAERGTGWGDVLVQAVLDDVRRQGGRIDPLCWFVVDFVERHPGYADLVSA